VTRISFAFLCGVLAVFRLKFTPPQSVWFMMIVVYRPVRSLGP